MPRCWMRRTPQGIACQGVLAQVMLQIASTRSARNTVADSSSINQLDVYNVTAVLLVS